jgi:hypothetical protein
VFETLEIVLVVTTIAFVQYVNGWRTALGVIVGSELIALQINIKKSRPKVKLSSEEDHKFVGGVAVASSGFSPDFGLGLRLLLLIPPNAFRLSHFGYGKQKRHSNVYASWYGHGGRPRREPDGA